MSRQKQRGGKVGPLDEGEEKKPLLKRTHSKAHRVW